MQTLVSLVFISILVPGITLVNDIKLPKKTNTLIKINEQKWGEKKTTT